MTAECHSLRDLREHHMAEHRRHLLPEGRQEPADQDSPSDPLRLTISNGEPAPSTLCCGAILFLVYIPKNYHDLDAN